jgi:hypothetical protein
MSSLEILVFVGGLLHFSILIASSMVPSVLDFKASLEKLDGLFRQLVWVHGIFIVLVITGFGLLSVCMPGEMASGSPLARGVCGFIAIFWGLRLIVQFFYFDPSEYLTTIWFKLGYHALTLVFTYHVVAYGMVACLGTSAS